MPTQVTVTAYTFDELSDKAKEKARQWWRDLLDVYDVSYATTEDAKAAGLELPEWDVFGGRPTCTVRFADGARNAAKLILANHGETCDTYAAAKQYLEAEGDAVAMEDAGDVDGAAEKLGEAENAFRAALQRAYAVMLKAEYEHAYSDAATDEKSASNEYLFTEEGKRQHAL